MVRITMFVTTVNEVEGFLITSGYTYHYIINGIAASPVRCYHRKASKEVVMITTKKEESVSIKDNGVTTGLILKSSEYG